MQLSQQIENKVDLLTAESKEQIDVWLKKFPEDKKQSAVISALFIAQDQNDGNLTSELIAAVADYLNIPRIRAEEVATFYSMYFHEKAGKYRICICASVSCLLCGVKDLVRHMKDKYGIGFNETTADGKFTLVEVECLGSCTTAPAMYIGKTYYENLTPEKLDKILAELD